ncbi:MAG: hypothetical protein UR69_C0003G0096 [Candidatus Moranbacteria bacterium GW2011_GWE2_35_2-]|nr:MAG: hypothetical protein UR69_C0003G0096 [Candidatus Moranbacteria bacterium GW2011_GWE2_35_2-]KKQ22115.1 MAG: hypothetical protein US37_C0004G0074 [Candidatus Moranbacteria bacterium GW2011_GWF2_37_11]KKQ29133.1 MAG: hypothetical protein US44_C0003G0045 [Candidatus Moranbacteria bacterium GW2011_GWD1_37_17]KKQ31118.1 MAG: hypothetical protein US47_C0001G0351 [Candidatus Moranbacteria bacterium GW2011_GWE1_37_24]KKQ47540.1 MAG: hypothetical protein US66_C0010G0017 [Candidatus Moranbacteria 
MKFMISGDIKTYTWAEILMWSFGLALIIILLGMLATYIDSSSVLFFYVAMGAIIIWGIIAGLSYDENSRFCIIRNSFLVACILMVALIGMLSMYIAVIEPPRFGNIFEKIFNTIVFATFPVFSFVGGFFIVGYLSAFAVKFFSNICKRK